MSVRIFGQHDEATAAQIHRCMAVGGARAVLCADGHKGYAQPIGGVIAYRDLVSISGVGFDIACGNLAIRTNKTGTEIRPKIAEIMDEVVRTISFGMGRHPAHQIRARMARFRSKFSNTRFAPKVTETQGGDQIDRAIGFRHVVK